MDDERPHDGGHDNGSVDSGDIDRRPSWILASAGVLVALVVVVSVATRDNQSTDDEGSLPATTEPESGPTSVSPAFADEPGSEPTVDLDLDQLSLSEAVSASLPAGGIDGWVFSLDGLSRLTRTDLTTGEESRIGLRDESRSEFEFVISQSRLVQIADKVVWAGPEVLYLVNIETMEVTSVEHLNGPAVMVANDDDTVWLRAFNDLARSTSVFSIDVETLDVGEPFGLDPLATGVVVGGASNGVLRYYVPFGGSWEFEAGAHRRVDTAIVAGTNGGTLEVRCERAPDDCVTIIHNINTSAETQIDASLGTFGPVLSPMLDAVAAFGTVVYTDGTVIALPTIGEWTWSTDGRFLASDDLVVVDLAGQHAPFQLPAGGRSTPRQEVLVVLRPSG